MSTIYLKVKGLAGSEVLQVSKEAIELANKVGVAVEFDFNGVVCVARPNESAESLAKNWEQEVSSKKKYKFASSEEVNTVEKERIEITNIVDNGAGLSSYSGDRFTTYSFNSKSKIEQEKLPEIKKAIEQVLNPEPSSKKEEVEDKPLFTIDEIKSCCYDDSAGGGCLYLSLDKLQNLKNK